MGFVVETRKRFRRNSCRCVSSESPIVAAGLVFGVKTALVVGAEEKSCLNGGRHIFSPSSMAEAIQSTLAQQRFIKHGHSFLYRAV